MRQAILVLWITCLCSPTVMAVGPNSPAFNFSDVIKRFHGKRTPLPAKNPAYAMFRRNHAERAEDNFLRAHTERWAFSAPMPKVKQALLGKLQHAGGHIQPKFSGDGLLEFILHNGNVGFFLYTRKHFPHDPGSITCVLIVPKT